MKDAALAALVRKPGRPAKERDWQLEAARAEIGQLTEASRPKLSSWRSWRESSPWPLAATRAR